MPEDEPWFRRNWTTPVILLGIFLVALYLRTYFPWDLAIQGRLLSGGSDAFYYERIINYNVETGRQLIFDCRLNYPICLTNPRPPLYSWTVAVAAKAFSPLFADLHQSVSVVFLSSTAVWGALTIFPMYFLANEAFGRRSALLAAFFLAILPAHLQRSPATNGDHDAMVLFFVVAAFFFFLKSLKSLHEKRWVESWSFWTKDGRKSIRAGVGLFFAENRRSALYAMLSGWSLSAIALIWQGWAYAPIILLVYFLFQILVHRFRNQDPMGILIAFGIALGLPLLVAFPWYFSMNQIQVWYDVPSYLYLAAIGLGLVFTMTRDYPWALVIPAVVGTAAGALVVLSFLYPAIGAAFVSGAGYFVRTKAFETIAEAQPPGLSQIILSFGVATYFLSLFGLLWLARGIPKRPTPDYLFVVVWAIAAIFMAQAAARFIFNASPAFAMTSAWVTVLILEWLRFDEMRKTFRSLGGRRLTALRRSVKPRHIIGSVFIVFLLLLPNVWSGVDASIPFERKAEFDRQVYNAFPDFLRSARYAQVSQGGGAFYFGAFGYSLPLANDYFPAAWRWFRAEDAHILPVEARPAFLSWWDYGFEAVDVGAHPTVADNFLDGYHLAGNFITAQSEAEAVALLNLRLLEGDFRANNTRFSAEARQVLTSFDLPADTLETVYQRPQDFIPAITAAPERYGRYESLQAYNALYIYAGEVLTSRLDLHELAAMNHALRQVVGASIRYFAVDTRLFPLDGENTGIFYAPAKLSDHRIVTLQDGRSVPRDFFDVMATTQRGVINVVDVRDTDQISDLTLRYKDRFYNSMFYRAYIGYAPRDVGLTCSDCIPGLPSPTNQSIANFPPMQAWNLSHFRLVYKTAYYNPFPPEELANHTDAWQAMDFPEAQELQGKINRGEATGVVDLSPASTIRRGIVFLKYYDGAFVNGTVTLGGFPWPNVRVTVHDEFGIPHYTTRTDAEGRYSVLVPFGEVRLFFALGTLNSRTQRGETTLRELTLTVSDAAAMRENVDADGDGRLDWLIVRDVAIPGEVLEGILYVDLDRDGVLDAVEPVLAGAQLTMQRRDIALTRSAPVGADGRFRVEGLYPGSYNVTVAWQGRTIELAGVPIGVGIGPRDLPIAPTTLRGFAVGLQDAVVAGATLTLRDLANGTAFRTRTDGDGAFSFRGLLPGDFELLASAAGQESLPARLSLARDATEAVRNVTLYPVATVSLRTAIGGTPQPFVTVAFTQRSSERLVRIATTDRVGEARLALPAGTWDVHARHFSGDLLWAFVGSLTARAGDTVTYGMDLTRGAIVRGTIFDAGNRSSTFDGADIVFRGAAGEYRIRTDSAGRYLTHLPLGTWTAQVSHFDFALVATRTIGGDTTFDLPVPRGASVQGTVVRTLLGNAAESPGIADATLRFHTGAQSFVAMSAAGGAFAIALPLEGSFALEVTRPGFEPLTVPARPAVQWQTEGRVALVATNVTASGTLRLDSTAFTDSTLPVTFLPLDGGAVKARATLDGTGRYTVALQPGQYEVSAERNETQAGDVRLGLRSPTTLAVPVGAGPIARDLDLVRRYRIDGTVSLSGDPRTTPVRFEGPDVAETEATDGLFTAFLAAGTYTLTANTTEGPDRFLALQRLDVSAPATLSVSLLRATELRGAVRHEDVPVESTSVTFARTEGGTVRVTTDDQGEYRTFVLGGTYTVSVDHRTTVQRGAGVLYVRFTFAGSLTIPQDSGFQLFNVDVVRSLDNTTVSGTVRFRGNPVSAQLAVRVSGANGIDTTSSTTSGSYALPIQPGEYDVYAVAPLEGAAFLGRLDVPPDGRTFDVDLRPSVRVSGATTLRGTRIAATLSFTSPTGRATIATDASGIYQLQLPPASYGIEATASGTERGTAVNYRGTANVTIEGSTLLNVAVTKVVRLGVGIEWDAAQRTEVRPGGTVVYSVTLRNTGNEDDTYLLTTIATGFTLEFEEDDVSIPFGTTGNVRTVRVTITAHGDARVDHAPISVTARSLTDGSVTRSVNLALDVTRFRGLSATVSSDAPTWDGRFLNYSIEVRNTGNAPETIRLSLPNADELRAAGWRAVLSGPSGSGETIDIGMGANSTLKPILRLEKAGGSAGTLSRVNVANTADPTLETLLTVNVQMPVLAVEGDIRAIGPGITVVEPGIDLATAAFLVSLAAVVAAAAYLAILRRRSR